MTLSLDRLRASLLSEPTVDFTRLPLLHKARRHLIQNLQSTDLRNAAVLVPVVQRTDGWQLILTRRTEHLRHHAGQVSFPGGAAETHDASAADTAKREAQEEIGLDPEQVEIVGYLPEHPVISGFSVTPVVAAVSGTVNYRLDPVEVSAVFEVPWHFAADSNNHLTQRREVAGVMREFYRLQYHQFDIWGATAGMLVDLVQTYQRGGIA